MDLHLRRMSGIAVLVLIAACGSVQGPGTANDSKASSVSRAGGSPRPSGEPVASAASSVRSASPAPATGTQLPVAKCVAGEIPAAEAMVISFGGTLLYDVSDSLHPQAICRITNTSAHILTGTSFEYLVPQPNGTTSVVLHSLGSNNESVVATFHADLSGSNLGSPYGQVSWQAAGAVLSYSTVGGTDSNGMGTNEIWVATPASSKKLFSYPIPGVDSFGRPGLPPQILAVSPDSNYLVAGWAIGANHLRVFRLLDSVEVTPPMPDGVRSAVWSRTGHTLYIVGGPGVESWTPESGAANVSGTGPWTLDPNFSPDGSSVAFTAFTSTRDIRVYVYDFTKKSSRILVDQPRSSAFFIKSQWVWYAEEEPCVQSADNACFDPTVPDGNVLAINVSTGQEAAVTFKGGESPVGPNETYIGAGDLWPLG
jgi:hypothetical protein